MLILLLTWLQILWLSLVFGIAAQRLVNRFMGWEDRTLPPDHLVVLGFLTITALGSLTVLFYPMNALAEGGFILTGLLLTVLFHRRLPAVWRASLRGFRRLGLPLKILLGLMLAIVVRSQLNQVSHVDTWLYHAQAVRWIQEFGTVPGLGNLHGRFAFNSHFFIPTALFSFAFTETQLVFPINSFFFLLCSTRLLYQADRGIRREDWFTFLLNALLLVFLSYFVITFVNSSSTDLISSVLIFYLFLLFLQYGLRPQRGLPVFLIWATVMVLITFKLSNVFLVVILPFTLWPVRPKEIAALGALGLLILLPFLARNVILSGYLLYPAPGIDLVEVDWKIPKADAVFEKKLIEAWPRLTSAERNAGTDITIEHGLATIKHQEALYILDVPFREWATTWFMEKGSLTKGLILLGFLSFVPMLIAFGKKDHRIAILYLTILINLLFWFLKAPDPRFVLGFLLFGAALSTAYFGAPVLKKISPSLHLPANAILAVLFLVFLSQKHQTILEDPLEARHWIIPNAYESVETFPYPSSRFELMVPANGDQCFYSDLPCTPYPRENLELRGDDLHHGFRIARVPSR